MAKYHTLLIRPRYSESAKWEIHFGDYDRSIVQEEREDIIQHRNYHTMIISHLSDLQSYIEAAVMKLNQRAVEH